MEIAPENLSEKARYDYELVNRALEGDQKSYAELMERYRDAIYFMLLKMVNNKSDAEDLTLEAFGKAFKKIHQYTPNYAFSTWLFKIATNNCIDFIRKRKANIVSIDQNIDDQEGQYISPTSMLSSGNPDPEEKLIKEQNIQLIQDIVSKLKPRYRKLVELRYFKEYSYEEIADELNLPLGTVKAQLFRARELLSNILNNLPPHH
ncbi:MAG TPA: sigma-70 family RNA polymerase sigma factor [Tenuifilaceae bacterium]|jgi:RNA polymerase sigma-70 factor (ECF subfamily)|nr:sigma-70 family RNA polymerase sigma factor [Bacteroidales bacterium]HNT40972.1 sigma-70 family RNA polymerase sigma factor [Tenuifilaceae bacterium]MBP8643222.1 sigma-70 family RNA polymerase sigma factor [Bacteroidales bacterium]NLI88742.1 sigma-70 family RNA polymerase sigma factor [Bacteroidales bacterium]HNY09841.1 sigma-70 family RNA polymerase sigma factor [Tenuifilaceae bacterium]